MTFFKKIAPITLASFLAMTPGCTGTALENNETAMTGEEDKEASGVFNPANDSSPDAQTPGHTGTADSN